MTQRTRMDLSAPAFKQNADAAVENNDILTFLSSFPSEKTYLSYCRMAFDLEKRRRLLLDKDLLSEREKENYEKLYKKVQFIRVASEVFQKQKAAKDAVNAAQEEELEAEKREEEARIAEDEHYRNLSEDEDNDDDDLMPSEYWGSFGKELLF